MRKKPKRKKTKLTRKKVPKGNVTEEEKGCKEVARGRQGWRGGGGDGWKGGGGTGLKAI